MAQITISPGTSDLGTITSDIQYTVTSDTTGTLTASIVVNGAPFAQQALTSGVPSAISVMQLPTGAGNISLTATLVESGGGATTQNVTWTYTKTPINFSNSGSVASLAINGQNILPTTLAEAVRTSPVWGGSLDLALQKLSSAAFYETVTPTAQLGSLTPGDIIYLNENGSPVEFYVASLNYEPSYNTNRVLVVRKNGTAQGAWNNITSANIYDGSTIDKWMNETYLQTLDSDVQTAIGTTNIPYISSGATAVVERISKSVFALSGTEYVGSMPGSFSDCGELLDIASLLYSNIQTSVWSRSPRVSSTSDAININHNGGIGEASITLNYPYQPAFTLPTTFTAYIDTPTTGLYDIQNNLLLSIPGANIETGSYVGTGTYGQSNPNTLTFGFVPKVVFVLGDKPSSGTTASMMYFWGASGFTMIYASYSGAQYLNSASTLGSTMSWFSLNSEDYQCNLAGVTYNYLAIS